jgi:hypothetical protein
MNWTKTQSIFANTSVRNVALIVELRLIVVSPFGVDTKALTLNAGHQNRPWSHCHQQRMRLQEKQQRKLCTVIITVKWWMKAVTDTVNNTRENCKAHTYTEPP